MGFELNSIHSAPTYGASKTSTSPTQTTTGSDSDITIPFSTKTENFVGTKFMPHTVPTSSESSLPSLFNLFNLFGSNNESFDSSNDIFMMQTMNMFQMIIANAQKYNGASKNIQFNTNTNLASLKNVYNSKLGNTLAQVANDNARKTNTTGKCAHEVNDVFGQCGLANGDTRAASAYQVGDKLATSKNFKQVDVSKADLDHLPAGCVIVWDKSQGHEHGHITVTLGDGREASDHIIDHIYKPNASYRVFVPVDTNK